jgi:hypothetical protein
MAKSSGRATLRFQTAVNFIGAAFNLLQGRLKKIAFHQAWESLINLSTSCTNDSQNS